MGIQKGYSKTGIKTPKTSYKIGIRNTRTLQYHATNGKRDPRDRRNCMDFFLPRDCVGVGKLADFPGSVGEPSFSLRARTEPRKCCLESHNIKESAIQEGMRGVRFRTPLCSFFFRIDPGFRCPVRVLSRDGYWALVLIKFTKPSLELPLNS